MASNSKPIKLRDVLFLVHAKPKDAEQKALWERLISNTLATPETWEVSLSATKGENKKGAWEKLLSEGKLGALALLRNLRNMQEAQVDNALINDALGKMNVSRVLPFRFIAAAKYAPMLEPALEAALFRAIAELPKMKGKTAIVVDHSGSMDQKLSEKSQMTYFESACALGILARELFDDVTVVTFGATAAVVPPRRGFALRDAMMNAHVGHSTMTQLGIDLAAKHNYDRIIVLSDEQSHTSIHNPIPESKAYFVNVASNKNGLGYGAWTHFDGFSEAILTYISAVESGDNKNK